MASDPLGNMVWTVAGYLPYILWASWHMVLQGNGQGIVDATAVIANHGVTGIQLIPSSKQSKKAKIKIKVFPCFVMFINDAVLIIFFSDRVL
ncbi:hypothetical protein ABEO83_10325 [Bacillus glycinifermentans]|uniref:hypothetical protein n=1 Tax=Bacillus glycinifermentans TaxID=1664069 RepID=UPI003D214938